MPFKSFSARKSLTTLDAEVRAAASFSGGQVVAFVTSDPVRISVHSFAGNDRGKVTNVALDGADDIALINKAVAVVKSGDALWALLDIQHRPKIEQVGRDIRSLHACPGGETALAIGWDGQGAELRLQANEVGGRQFAIRGSLRTASLGEGVTYVVAEGPGGGQFRVHPGKTPETGATLRVDLPAQATSMDKLSGGEELSALHKRGSSLVCIIRKHGVAGLEAKMVQLASDAVAVDVIGTTLFAVASHGELSLYSGDELQRAGDAPMTPTSTMDARASGEPTMLLTSTKGGNRIWLGTRSGDVIRCEAVKRGLDI